MVTKRVVSPKRKPVKKRKVKVKRPQTPKTYTIQMMCDALRKTGGKVYLAAKALGCTAAIIHKRKKDNVALQTVIRQARGELLDLAENQLAKAIKRGEAWAILGALKTLGKHRGYVEGTKASQTINVNTLAPVQTINYDAMPLKLRLELLEEYDKQQGQTKLLAPPSEQVIEGEGTIIED